MADANSGVTTGTPAPQQVDPRESAEPEDAPSGFGRRPIVVTTVVAASFGALGHGVLWLREALHWPGVYWQPVVGICLVVVSITAFGGFYVASRRARIAIAASFLLTFLVSLTYVLTIQGLADAAGRGAARDLFNDFRAVVITIIGFYFGSETIVSVAKVWGMSRTTGAQATRSAVQRADRDLVTTRGS